MTVERFYETTWVQEVLAGEAASSVRLDGETWSLPRFMADQGVWAAGRPATVVALLRDHVCGAHRGEYAYSVRFLSASTEWTPWPYCESQLSPRE